MKRVAVVGSRARWIQCCTVSACAWRCDVFTLLAPIDMPCSLPARLALLPAWRTAGQMLAPLNTSPQSSLRLSSAQPYVQRQVTMRHNTPKLLCPGTNLFKPYWMDSNRDRTRQNRCLKAGWQNLMAKFIPKICEKRQQISTQVDTKNVSVVVVCIWYWNSPESKISTAKVV